MKKLLSIIIINLICMNLSYAGFFDFFSSKQKVTICYFSLNNEKELGVTQDFIDSINISSEYDIDVKEFHSNGDDPRVSFKDMVESGVRCDGLVISGHHTSSFGGQRARGQLSIDFMEGLNCNEDYYKWFQNIKSLWLQGCRTLGAKIVEERDVAYHADRVSADLVNDNLQLTREELSRDFATLLDKNNPLSKRYIRIFPKATVFGWTETAPGETWGSENSLAFHMANLTKLTHPKISKIENPLHVDEQAKEYNDAILELLLRDDQCDDLSKRCFENREDLYVQAWINHGHAEKYPYSFMNNKLEAHASLLGKSVVKKDLELERLTRKLSCALQSETKQLEAISQITKNPKVLSYMSYILTKFALESDDSMKKDIYSILANSEDYFNQLKEALLSSSHGLNEKMDSYLVYQEILGVDNSSVYLKKEDYNSLFLKSIQNSFVDILVKSKSRLENDLKYIESLHEQIINFNTLDVDSTKLINKQMLDTAIMYYMSYIKNKEIPLKLRIKSFNLIYKYEKSRTNIDLNNIILSDILNSRSNTRKSPEEVIEYSRALLNINEFSKKDIISVLDLYYINEKVTMYLLQYYFENYYSDENESYIKWFLLMSKQIHMISYDAVFLAKAKAKVYYHQMIYKAFRHKTLSLELTEAFFNSLIYVKNNVNFYNKISSEHNLQSLERFLLSDMKILDKLISKKEYLKSQTIFNLFKYSQDIMNTQTVDTVKNVFKALVYTRNKKLQRDILNQIRKRPQFISRFDEKQALFLLNFYPIEEEDLISFSKNHQYTPVGMWGTNWQYQLLIHPSATLFSKKVIMNNSRFFEYFGHFSLENYKQIFSIAKELDQDLKLGAKKEKYARNLYFNNRLYDFVEKSLESNDIDILKKVELLVDFRNIAKSERKFDISFITTKFLKEILDKQENILESETLNDSYISELIYAFSAFEISESKRTDSFIEKVLEHSEASFLSYRSFMEVVGSSKVNIKDVNSYLDNIKGKIQLLEKNNIDKYHIDLLNFYKNTNKSKLEIKEIYINSPDLGILFETLLTKKEIYIAFEFVKYQKKTLSNTKVYETLTMINKLFRSKFNNKTANLNIYLQAYGKLRKMSENIKDFDLHFSKELDKNLYENLVRSYEREVSLRLYGCLLSENKGYCPQSDVQTTKTLHQNLT